MRYGTKSPNSLKRSFPPAGIPPKDTYAENGHPESRNPPTISPLKIIVLRCLYFSVFYSVLLGFSLGYLTLFMHFQIKRDYPTLTGLSSSLELNPGLSTLPLIDIYTSLISFVANQPQSIDAVTSQLRAFLLSYQLPSKALELSDCSKASHALDINRPCYFDLNRLGPCNIWNAYGFEDDNPCILLKINRIYGWVPDPVPFADGVLVICEGASKDDTHNLGEIRYFDFDFYQTTSLSANKTEGKSSNGTFPSAFFPYLNQPQYQQPIVFVVFYNMKPNTLVRVQCYLIAKNIRVDIARGEGSVKFEIMSR
ncbi:hypothetical protein AAHC03_04786 [Spirometra sp. Aus1]